MSNLTKRSELSKIIINDTKIKVDEGISETEKEVKEIEKEIEKEYGYAFEIPIIKRSFYKRIFGLSDELAEDDIYMFLSEFPYFFEYKDYLQEYVDKYKETYDKLRIELGAGKFFKFIPFRNKKAEYERIYNLIMKLNGYNDELKASYFGDAMVFESCATSRYSTWHVTENDEYINNVDLLEKDKEVMLKSRFAEQFLQIEDKLRAIAEKVDSEYKNGESKQFINKKE